MCSNGGGVILNIASQLGHVAVEGAAAYCTTKGAILQFTRSLALDHAEDNIRVVALSPGAIETPRLTDIFGSPIAAEKTLGPLHPVGRLGTTDEGPTPHCFWSQTRRRLLLEQILSRMVATLPGKVCTTTFCDY